MGKLYFSNHNKNLKLQTKKKEKGKETPNNLLLHFRYGKGLKISCLIHPI